MADPVWKSNSDEPLKLSSFRGKLIRQEETIIFALIERAQFKRNPSVYTVGEGLGELSLLEYMLKGTEELHAKVRRYTSPDENPFFTEVVGVKPVLPVLDYPKTIRPNDINFNEKVKTIYTNTLLDAITLEGDDPNTYGSTSVADISCLQALSSRIHFGKYIAEAKFQASTEQYTALIKANNAEGLMSLLTDLAVEERVLDRVELKASTYGQDPQNTTEEHKVDPKIIRRLYKEVVMPMTKEVQVEYLLQRLEHPMVAVCGGGVVGAKERFGNVGLIELDDIEAVFTHVMSNTVAYGVVPWETKTDGILKKTKLLFNSTPGIKITGEITQPTTRYLILGKSTPTPSGADRTALTFGVPHHTGALLKSLDIFQQAGINLTAIESLPQDEAYNFFVELQGHIDDSRVADAISQLEERTTYVRHLGSYPSSV